MPAGACFRYGIHGVLIDFDNPVHFFHVQHDAAQYGNRAVGNAGTGAAGGNRHNEFIGQLHDSGYFFRAVDPYNHFRQMHQAGVSLFVSFKAVQGFRIGLNVGFAYNFFQFFQQFSGYGIVLAHNISSFTR